MARIDYEDVGPKFERARALHGPSIEGWMDAIAARVTAGPASTILDLGCGTGMFSDAMARRFHARVVGVEPAAAMREASAQHAHPLVSYIAGDAMHIPLRNASCVLAWLSTMIHHVRDLQACAREVRRVVAHGGVVLIRSSFPGRHAQITLFRLVPGASAVASSFPTVEATVEAFERAGFTYGGIEGIEQVSAPGMREFVERVRTRADTTLQLLDDGEYDAAVARLEADLEDNADSGPIVDRIDLMTFRG